MKHPGTIITMLVALIYLVTCTNPENNKLIIGNWAGSEWLVDGKPSNLNARNTYFSFNEKGEYSFDYSGTVEKGTYKVENDMLFTTPAGQREIMVKIRKLTPDSLVFDMNRSGQPEALTLLRK